MFWKSSQRPPKLRILSRPDPNVQAWIEDALQKGIIDRISREKAHCILPIFAIPKPNGKIRLIFDLRRINAYTKPPRFKLEGLRLVASLIRPFDLLVKVDLKDAFYHIAHAKADLPYVCFEYKGQTYTHTAMSMGSASSPFVFAKMTKPMLKKWRGRGIRVVIYLDDMLLMAPENLIASQRETILEDLQNLGWTLNPEKSSLTPSHSKEFLGVEIVADTEQPYLKLPKKKRNAIAHEFERFSRYKDQMVPCRFAMRIAGLGVSISPVMPEAEALVRPLFRGIGQISPTDWNKKSTLLSREIRSDIVLLAQRVRMDPRRLLQPEARIEIRSDACPRGLGATVILNGKVLHTIQRSVRDHQHINLTELQAVHLALSTFGKTIRDLGHNVVKLKIDNTTSAAYVRRGTGRSPRLAQMARKIVMLGQSLDLTLLPEFIPGKENCLADILSRFLNHRAEGFDEPYLFPTPRPTVVFRAIEVATTHSMVLITPYWKSAPWFPILLSRTEKAKRFHLNKHPLGLNHKTGFTAWQCSSEIVATSQKNLDSYATLIERSDDWVWHSRS